jgi:hypothetical protein
VLWNGRADSIHPLARRTGAQVAPPCDQRVGGPDDFLGEHPGRPELGRHQSPEDDAPKSRCAARPPSDRTAPTRATGTLPRHSSTANGTRGPCASQSGPTTRRVNASDTSPTTKDVRTCELVGPKPPVMTGRTSLAEYHATLDTNSPNHAQWKARMCGRWKLPSLISQALCSCSGTTSRSYFFGFGLLLLLWLARLRWVVGRAAVVGSRER